MSKKFSTLIVCSAILVAIPEIKAQVIDSAFFKSRELNLVTYYKVALNSEGYSKIQAENSFCDSLVSVLKTNGSFFYSFDSLPKIGKIASSDGRLKIYSWNFTQKAGYSKYYCILQYYSKRDKKFMLYKLTEDPGFLQRYPQNQADPMHWPGVLYYKIIDKKYKGQTYYTLLGFDFNDILTNIKTIDILAFDEQNVPNFPQKLFLSDGKPKNRIIFEYAERAQMMIDYNAAMDMIVCDHLSPAKPSMELQYQFYGPDFTYDGYSFEEGIWVQHTDVQIRY
jgi:hypothetical protein